MVPKCPVDAEVSGITDTLTMDTTAMNAMERSHELDVPSDSIGEMELLCLYH